MIHLPFCFYLFYYMRNWSLIHTYIIYLLNILYLLAFYLVFFLSFFCTHHTTTPPTKTTIMTFNFTTNMTSHYITTTSTTPRVSFSANFRCAVTKKGKLGQTSTPAAATKTSQKTKKDTFIILIINITLNIIKKKEDWILFACIFII